MYWYFLGGAILVLFVVFCGILIYRNNKKGTNVTGNGGSRPGLKKK